ncbi:hypothetical protein IWQ60_009747, partial [Tieghemiomyces parasiticus]
HRSGGGRTLGSADPPVPAPAPKQAVGHPMQDLSSGPLKASPPPNATLPAAASAKQPDRGALLAAAEKRAQASQKRGLNSSTGPGKIAQKLTEQQQKTTKQLQEEDYQRERIAAEAQAWKAD